MVLVAPNHNDNNKNPIFDISLSDWFDISNGISSVLCFALFYLQNSIGPANKRQIWSCMLNNWRIAVERLISACSTLNHHNKNEAYIWLNFAPKKVTFSK